MPQPIQIQRAIASRILEHAQEDSRRECCGLLGGAESTITHVFPAANAAENPQTAYEIAPQEVFRILREMRAKHLEMLGIYHSHPSSDNAPSPRDIELAYYSEAAYFVVSPLEGATRPLRAFSIRDGIVCERMIELV